MSRPLYAADCETDPFEKDRVPKPFLWGIKGENSYETFEKIQEFMDYCAALPKKSIVYFHNGGKFDIHFMLPFFDHAKAQIINGRIVRIPFGNIEFRDSFACAPAPLSATGAKTEIEYWKLEKQHRLKHSHEIGEYLKQDCVALFDLMSRYHDKVGRKTTIAANALSFATNQIGIDIGKTTYTFDKTFRPFYFGGRVEARRGGLFKDVHIYDIKSAYPTAMMDNHPHGNKYTEYDGYLKDAHFYKVLANANNCFPLKDETGKLQFPKGRGEYLITHWELETALELDLVEDLEVLSSIKFLNTITFKDYINYWYAEKEKAEKEGNKRDRLIAKFLLNSLYGKMAQNPLNYQEWEFHKPGTTIDFEKGFELSHTLECFDGSKLEIHRRDMIHKLEEEYGNGWQKENIYFNVATGASITGFVRAMLVRAIHTVGEENVIYCDTDSVACLKPMQENLIGKELGDWDLEGFAKEMIICGRKLYGIKWEDGTTKVSSKGARLEYKDIVSIHKGNTHHWENIAPTFSLSRGIVFIDRKIRATI